MTIAITQTAAVCAIGIGVKQCSASFRAGLSGYAQTSFVGRSGEPLVMALVPELHVDELQPALMDRPLSDRERRMLRLGGMALDPMRQAIRRRPALYLALPDANPNRRPYADRDFLGQLAQQAQLELDLDASRSFTYGRAGGLFALKAAMAALSAGRDAVLVGGIDTPWDLTWLTHLDAERRLLGADVKDGFVPGEAAAFVLLERHEARARELTCVRAAGTAEDPGHRYADTPALGIGLAAALDEAMGPLSAAPPIKTCFAGLNGENFGAKAWGVAHIRHHERFDPALYFEHPADCFGDVGAAMGPLLIALADETLRAGHRPGPMLVWAASDYAPVGCVYLTKDT